MKLEGSLPWPQKPSIFSHPEPDESSAYIPSYFSKIHLNIILTYV
jgi:hypothetical protein